MPLTECMEKHTHRQFLAWMAYLDSELDKPTPLMYYLMQIAQEVRRVLSKNPADILLEHFKLERVKGKNEPTRPNLTPDEATAISKAKWGLITGRIKPGRDKRG